MMLDGVNLGGHTFVMGMKIHNQFGLPATIGRFCSISLNLTLLGYDHAIMSVPKAITTFPFDTWWQAPSFPGVTMRGPITIGSDVWIGQNVSIRIGVTVGDGAIIGAGSVVMKDVKPYAIVGGNPIRHIRYRYPKDQIEKLLQIRWWDWPDDQIRQQLHLFHDIDAFLAANS